MKISNNFVIVQLPPFCSMCINHTINNPNKKVVTPRFELGSREPKSRMLPLHHATSHVMIIYFIRYTLDDDKYNVKYYQHHCYLFHKSFDFKKKKKKKKNKKMPNPSSLYIYLYTFIPPFLSMLQCMKKKNNNNKKKNAFYSIC